MNRLRLLFYKLVFFLPLQQNFKEITEEYWAVLCCTPGILFSSCVTCGLKHISQYKSWVISQWGVLPVDLMVDTCCGPSWRCIPCPRLSFLLSLKQPLKTKWSFYCLPVSHAKGCSALSLVSTHGSSLSCHISIWQQTYLCSMWHCRHEMDQSL